MKQALLLGLCRCLVGKDPYRGTVKRSIGARLLGKLNLTRRYVTSYYRSRKRPKLFENVKTYCMLFGHCKSGGSLTSGLLDAHPNAILPDEEDVLQYLWVGFTRDQILQQLLRRSRKQAKVGRRDCGRPAYLVPGQWQGRYEKLLVIGHNKGGTSTQRIAQDPALLDGLRDILRGIKVKLIHIVRNPYDVVSAMHLRSGRNLASGIEYYFANCEAILNIQKRTDSSEMLMVRHEEFIAHPRIGLRAICHFLGIEASDDYLDACESLIHKSLAPPRSKVRWDPRLVQIVRSKLEKYDFLQGYTYETQPTVPHSECLPAGQFG